MNLRPLARSDLSPLPSLVHARFFRPPPSATASFEARRYTAATIRLSLRAITVVFVYSRASISSVRTSSFVHDPPLRSLSHSCPHAPVRRPIYHALPPGCPDSGLRDTLNQKMRFCQSGLFSSIAVGSVPVQSSVNSSRHQYPLGGSAVTPPRLFFRSPRARGDPVARRRRGS